MSNKLKKCGLLVVTALLLTGCSELRARPSDYNDPLMDGTYEETVVNNIVSVVEDALDDSGLTKTEVLKRVKLALAQSIYGSFEEMGAALAAGKDSAEFAALKNGHYYYTEETPSSLSEAQALQFQFYRLTRLVNDINKRVKETLYYEIAGGSYSKDNLFNEEKYANNLRTQLYKVVDPATQTWPTTWYQDVILIPQLQPEDVGDFALHLNYYDDYVQKEVVPNILLDLITEQYLYDENYSSLGRAYARKVNYIAISANADYPLAADYLFKEFIDQNILGGTYATANLEILANAWRGYANDFLPAGNEQSLLDNAGAFVKVIDGAEYYYKGTQYGDIREDYSLITDDPNTTDASVESNFSGGNTYPVEHGLELKTNTMRLVDYTTDGWYIKNGGLTSLPDSIRSRLFNIGVANGVDNVTDEMNPPVDPEDVVTSKYVRNINGYYYLTPATSQSDDDYNFLLFDSSSSTYYIVQIEEAVSSSKLSRDGSNNYTHIHDDNGEFMENVAREVAKTMGSGTTYDNQALLYYFELINLQFHDQEIYDYFHETFPEVWES